MTPTRLMLDRYPASVKHTSVGSDVYAGLQWPSNMSIKARRLWADTCDVDNESATRKRSERREKRWIIDTALEGKTVLQGRRVNLEKRSRIMNPSGWRTYRLYGDQGTRKGIWPLVCWRIQGNCVRLLWRAGGFFFVECACQWIWFSLHLCEASGSHSLKPPNNTVL